MIRDADFYLANLGSDIYRAARAAMAGDTLHYQQSLACSERTLAHLNILDSAHVHAHKEAVKLISGLKSAVKEKTLHEFIQYVNQYTEPLAQKIFSDV